MCSALQKLEDDARKNGIQEGMEKGLRDGRQEGLQEGMNLFATLISKLSEAGRTGDIERAATDASYRRQLLAEFSLE